MGQAATGAVPPGVARREQAQGASIAGQSGRGESFSVVRRGAAWVGLSMGLLMRPGSGDAGPLRGCAFRARSVTGLRFQTRRPVVLYPNRTDTPLF